MLSGICITSQCTLLYTYPPRTGLNSAIPHAGPLLWHCKTEAHLSGIIYLHNGEGKFDFKEGSYAL
jgi:hypothetical protein